MRFRVGPYVYRVRVTEEPLVDQRTGETLLGEAVFHSKELLVSGAVQPTSRLEVLLHELKHAWLFHFPPPANEEQHCSFFAAVSEQAMLDLAEQGGVEALARLSPSGPPAPPLEAGPRIAFDDPPPAEEKPEGTDEPHVAPPMYVHRFESKAKAHGGRVHCCTCGMMINAAAVVTGKPRWNPGAGGMTVDRALYCPHCDRLQLWTEGVNLYGTPNGGLVGDPVIRRGRQVEEFLRKNPQAIAIVP